MDLPIVVIIISIIWSIYKKLNTSNKEADKRKAADYMPPSVTTDWNELGGELMDVFNTQALNSDMGEPMTDTLIEPMFEPVMRPTTGSIDYDSPEGTEFHGDQHLTRPQHEYEQPQEWVSAHAMSGRPKLTQADMRRAVVMAEILGRPVSMRRR